MNEFRSLWVIDNIRSLNQMVNSSVSQLGIGAHLKIKKASTRAHLIIISPRTQPCEVTGESVVEIITKIIQCVIG